MGENSIICESDGCERDSETWIINAAYPGELCKPCHWYCSDCVAKLSADLQAARLTIATIERETLERAAKHLEADVSGDHFRGDCDQHAELKVRRLANELRSLAKNCPHGLDRRAKCALCAVGL